MKPSEYIRRQMFATFQDDPVGPAAYKLFGPSNYMWASDFPHTDSTWPESRKVVERDFAGVPEDVKRKIVFDNARISTTSTDPRATAPKVVQAKFGRAGVEPLPRFVLKLRG